MSTTTRWIISAVGAVTAFLAGFALNALNYESTQKALRQKDVELAQKERELKDAEDRWSLERQILTAQIKQLQSRSEEEQANKPVRDARLKELNDVSGRLKRNQAFIISAACHRGSSYFPGNDDKGRPIIASCDPLIDELDRLERRRAELEALLK